MSVRAKILINTEFSGFSYVEILVAILLIAIALIPVLESLQTAQLGTSVQESLSTQHFHLNAKLEEVLAEPYNSLNTAAATSASPTVMTSYSDVSGAINRRLVYLYGYDGDNADGDDDPFTGVDSNLMWVRVEIEGTAQFIETLSCN